MAKKVFDILPPKIAHKIEHGIRAFNEEQEKNAKNNGKKSHEKEVNLKKPASAGREKHFSLKEILAGVFVLILIIVGILYFTLQEVTVEIWPKTAVLNFKQQVTADNSASTLNVMSKIMPAQYLEQEKDLWQEFPSTGSASNDGKAQGSIVVYNNYSPASDLALKVGTHFLSDTGKYFVTLQNIIVPAVKKQNNKNVPGLVTVKVQAEESGEDYNIKPSKFSVPKLVGTAYYYSIYAESLRSMTGGFSGTIKKVSQDDISNAKDILEKKVLDSATQLLKNKIGTEYILLDNAISTNIVDSSSDVKTGAVVDKFNYQVKAKASALVFKRADLESFIKQYIGSNISSQQTFLENSVTFQYSPETIDIQNKKMVLNLDFSAKTYQTINITNLISLLSGKSANGIKEIVNTMMGDNASQIKIHFWPFWTQNAPQDKNKIKVTLTFD